MNGSDNLMRVKKEFHMFCNYYIISIFAQIINGKLAIFPPVSPKRLHDKLISEKCSPVYKKLHSVSAFTENSQH